MLLLYYNPKLKRRQGRTMGKRAYNLSINTLHIRIASIHHIIIAKRQSSGFEPRWVCRVEEVTDAHTRPALRLIAPMLVGGWRSRTSRWKRKRIADRRSRRRDVQDRRGLEHGSVPLRLIDPFRLLLYVLFLVHSGSFSWGFWDLRLHDPGGAIEGRHATLSHILANPYLDALF